MADTENEKPRRRRKAKADVNASELTSEALSASQDAESEMANEADSRLNLRDLASSASDLLSRLDDSQDASAAEAAGAADSREAVEASDGAQAEQIADALEASELTEQVASSIDWNAETADLSFDDELNASAEAEAEASVEAEAGIEATSESVVEAQALENSEGTAELEASPAGEAPAVETPAKAKKKSVKEQLADVSDRSERLQELARMVAKTVSERKSEMGLEGEGELSAEGAVAEEGVAPEPEQMGFTALEEELDAADNDADPEPTEFVDADQLISIIESMLFSTDKPVSLATIKSLFKGTNVRTKDIARSLDSLASEYASATRGVTLEEINGGYQLRTKVDNAEFLKRLQKVRPFRLSGPALETMAIVAYKQPVTKYEIDEIRGVESGHLLRALMERGLVQFAGKAEDKPGKPMAYGSTRKFLETFGLRNLRELPTLSEIDELLPEGIGEVEEKEKLSDITDELSQDFAGGYSDNEEELGKINDTLQAIDTTSEFFEQEKQRERERRDRDRAQDLRERLVLGEVVDPKDQRWLERYEAKLHAETQAAETGTPTTISADQFDPETPITGDLESLTAEGGADDEQLAKAAKGDHAELTEVDNELNASDDHDDENEELGDLESNLDWDDDAEAEDEDTSGDV